MSDDCGKNQHSENTRDSDYNDDDFVSREVGRNGNQEPHYKEGKSLEVAIEWVAQLE